MKKGNTELFIAGIIVIAIVLLATGALKVKDEPPLKKAPVVNITRIPSPKEVINDISRELSFCYDHLDECNRHLSSCFRAYTKQQKAKETSP